VRDLQPPPGLRVGHAQLPPCPGLRPLRRGHLPGAARRSCLISAADPSRFAALCSVAT
jgi:hypothetical protein